MTPIVDIVGYLVASMIPQFSGIITGSLTSTYIIVGLSRTDLFFVGQKVKVVGVSPVVTSYCIVVSIVSSTEITVMTSDVLTTGKANNDCTIQGVLNYHYGHRVELVNRFSEITRNANYKKWMFPALCLFTDIEEKINNNGYDRECDLNLVIMTDTKPGLSSSERKTNSFDPILQPLYELFFERIRQSVYIADVYPDHSKFDRYFWGKNGLYGNTGNIFNDFIDAIEIDNLTIKTFKNC